MGNNLFTSINNYEIYTNVTDEDAVVLKKESFKIALKRLVNALNKYTDKTSKYVVRTLLENKMCDIKLNQYVYFDISGATVGEEEPHMYVIKFSWQPFYSIHIDEAKKSPVSSIGLYTGYVRWEHDGLRATYPMEFSDDITYKAWKDIVCINHKGGYFCDLNEYLFHAFSNSYYDYIEALLFLGSIHSESVVSGPAGIAAAFENASKLLSEYPKGIDYNESKECSKVDWFYHTLELTFNELDKKNNLDAAYFYMGMRDYVKEIEKTRFNDSIDMDEE